MFEANENPQALSLALLGSSACPSSSLEPESAQIRTALLIQAHLGPAEFTNRISNSFAQMENRDGLKETGLPNCAGLAQMKSPRDCHKIRRPDLDPGL